MKKILVLTLFTMFVLTSCNDALDILPADSIPAENAFTSVGDLQNGLNAVYNQYNPANMIDYSSNFTDDTKIGVDNGGQKVGFHQWVLAANSAEAQNMWLNCYATINSINRVLAAAQNITPESADEEIQYNKILGDCYALRAYLHLELLAHYGVSFESSADGVPISDIVVVFEQLPRNTSGEVFAAINADLDLATTYVSPSFTDKGYVTRDFITAVRARVALYSDNSSTALSATQELMAKYPLANKVQYANMFGNDTDNTEVIFKLYRTDGNNDQRIGGVWHCTGTGGAFMEMSNSLYNLLETNTSDVRYAVNVDPSSNPANNYHAIGKYLGKGGFAYLNDVKVFRVSEMYLIRAEILAKSGDYNGAAQLLKQIRDARTNSNTIAPNFNTLATAMDEILTERRKELAYEGFRYVDVKRTRSITNEGLERNTLDCGGAVPCSLPASDYRWTFPLPQAELNGNPNINQAPGY